MSFNIRAIKVWVTRTTDWLTIFLEANEAPTTIPLQLETKFTVGYTDKCKVSVFTASCLQ